MKNFTQSLRSLFGFSNPPAKASQPKADETDGWEVVFPLAGVAIQPTAGWLLLRPNLKQKDTDAQICEPTLMSRVGVITTLLFPADGLSPNQRVERFVAKSSGSVVDRKEMISDSGIQLIRLVMKTKPTEGGAEALSISHFFTNQQGRVLMMYFVGDPTAATKASEMMLKTLKHKSNGTC